MGFKTGGASRRRPSCPAAGHNRENRVPHRSFARPSAHRARDAGRHNADQRDFHNDKGVAHYHEDAVWKEEGNKKRRDSNAGEKEAEAGKKEAKRKAEVKRSARANWRCSGVCFTEVLLV